MADPDLSPAPGIPFTRSSDGSWSIKDPDSQLVLRFSRDEVAAFVDGCKRGEFDHLLPGHDPAPIAEQAARLTTELNGTGY